MTICIINVLEIINIAQTHRIYAVCPAAVAFYLFDKIHHGTAVEKLGEWVDSSELLKLFVLCFCFTLVMLICENVYGRYIDNYNKAA